MFSNHHYLQVDGTAQGLHMSCSYSDLKGLSDVPPVKFSKHFHDDMFAFWEHARDDLDNFFNFMKSTDSSKKYNLLYLLLLIMS